MQRSTDSAAQRQRRRDAIRSAATSSAWMGLTAAVLLLLRWHFGVDGFGGAVLLMIALLDLGAIVPVWILLRERLKEIEGGEEDAAAQY